MPPTQKTFYDFMKDIGIPLLNFLATVTIGVIIASVLKRREEKAKIKSLLIDNYMQYLNRMLQFHKHESASFTLKILKGIYYNFSDFFEEEKIKNITNKAIEDSISAIVKEKNSVNSDDMNWSIYTYKFAFLLSKKKYWKELLPLENNITNKYLDYKSSREFLLKLKNEIITNPDVRNQMNSELTIEEGLEEICSLISISYNNFQFKFFNPYSTKLAELIDRY
jgi:hypothetical protein